MRRPPLTDREKEQIAEMRSRGLSMGVIALTLKCHRGTVSWHCLMQGIEGKRPTRIDPERYRRHPMTLRKGRPVRAFPPDEDKHLLELDAAGTNYTDIGRILGRSRNSVQARLATLARREELEAPS